MNSNWLMLCINQTVTFIHEKQFVKTICFSNYAFHLIFAKWKWKEHLWFSIDLLFITVFENEISAKFIFSNEKTLNVKNFCVKMNCFEFNIQTTVLKHCWIEFVSRIIFFKSWKWKKQFCDSIFVDDHLKTKSKSNSSWRKNIERFHLNVSYESIISFYQVQ